MQLLYWSTAKNQFVLVSKFILERVFDFRCLRWMNSRDLIAYNENETQTVFFGRAIWFLSSIYFCTLTQVTWILLSWDSSPDNMQVSVRSNKFLDAKFYYFAPDLLCPTQKINVFLWIECHILNSSRPSPVLGSLTWRWPCCIMSRSPLMWHLSTGVCVFRDVGSNILRRWHPQYFFDFIHCCPTGSEYCWYSARLVKEKGYHCALSIKDYLPGQGRCLPKGAGFLPALIGQHPG